MSGWISIHRKIQDHWLWEEKPFDKRSAWIDLLLMANHKDNKFLLGNELIEVRRGSFITSEAKLMERWGWSNTKVRSFLSILESDGMIVKQSDSKKSAITIVNYSDYQVLESEKEVGKKQEKSRQEVGKHTNNNDNNDNNDNKKYIIYAEFVKMTEEEYNKLVEKHGEELVNKMIAVLDNYKGSKGKKYKSDYRAILNWVEDKVLKENGGSNGNSKGNGREDTWDIEHLINRN